MKLLLHSKQNELTKFMVIIKIVRIKFLMLTSIKLYKKNVTTKGEKIN